MLFQCALLICLFLFLGRNCKKRRKCENFLPSRTIRFCKLALLFFICNILVSKNHSINADILLCSSLKRVDNIVCCQRNNSTSLFFSYFSLNMSLYHADKGKLQFALRFFPLVSVLQYIRKLHLKKKTEKKITIHR